MKVLIVEDNDDMQEVYKDLLGNIYDIRIVENTKDAEKVVASEDIGLMILDIVLPGEAGDEFLQRIKDNPKFKGLAILAITVLGDISEHLRMIHPKVLCIPKPFDKGQLTDAIDKMTK